VTPPTPVEWADAEAIVETPSGGIFTNHAGGIDVPPEVGELDAGTCPDDDYQSDFYPDTDAAATGWDFWTEAAYDAVRWPPAWELTVWAVSGLTLTDLRYKRSSVAYAARSTEFMRWPDGTFLAAYDPTNGWPTTEIDDGLP
jgi:hypothetical protein